VARVTVELNSTNRNELDGSNNEDLDILQSTGPEMVIPKRNNETIFSPKTPPKYVSLS
jgi:hypothetical protein